MERLFTVSEVASYLNISPEIVRRKARNRELKGVKVGSLWRFKKSEIKKISY